MAKVTKAEQKDNMRSWMLSQIESIPEMLEEQRDHTAISEIEYQDAMVIYRNEYNRIMKLFGFSAR